MVKKVVPVFLMLFLMMMAVPSPPVVSAASAWMDVVVDGAPVRSDCKKSASTVKNLSYGTIIQTTGSVTNSSGNLWYKTSGGYIYSGNVSSHSMHRYSYYVSKSPTCMSQGEQTGVCVCGATVRSPIATVGHNFSSSNYFCTYGCGNYNPSSVSTVSWNSDTLYVQEDCIGHSGPYGGCPNNGSYKKGALLQSAAAVRNGYGHIWYRLSNGAYIFSDYVRIHNAHTWNGGSITKAPTCQATGTKTFTCTVCGQTKQESVAKVGHTYDSNTFLCVYGCGHCNPSSVKTASTAAHTLYVKEDCIVHSGPYGGCTTTGSYQKGALVQSSAMVTNGYGHAWYQLSNGAYLYSDYVKIHDVHTWDSGKVTKAPTCKETGIKTLACTVCGRTQVEVIAKVGHKYDSNTFMCVYGCGHYNPSSVKTTSTAAHTLYVKEDCVAHSGPYGDCGATGSYKKGALVQSAATVTNGYGHVWYQLSNGAYLYSDYIKIHDSHTWDSGKVTKAPTCQQTGTKTFTCTLCGQTKQGSVAKVSHKYDSDTFMCVYGCGTCNQSSMNVISVATHTLFIEKDGIAHSGPYGACTTTGSYKKGERILSSAMVTNGYGHVWFQLTNGSYIYSDYACIHDFHTWDGGKVTKTPTCQETGTKTFTCTFCGLTKQESIAKVGHQYNSSTHMCVYGCGTYDPGVAPTLSSVAIKSNPSKTSYLVGDTLNTGGLVLTAKYSNGASGNVIGGFTCTPTALHTAGTQKITVTYNGKTTAFYVTVASKGELKIISQPKTAVVLNGGTVTFTVAASGDGLGYQWQISDDSGKTWRNSAVKSATYTTTLTTANNGRRMRCVVSDKYGSKVTSGAATMWMSGLKITKQPGTAIVLNGGTVTFTVAASGDGLGYRWQISDDGGKTWRNSAVKSATYTTTLTAKINGRRMRCVVSDKYGNKIASHAAAMWLSRLKITTQPKTAVVLNGGTVKFTVAASGDGLGYQWQISDDGGKTWRNSAVKSATYTTTLTGKINGRRMRCIVSDKYGNKLASNTVAMWLSGLKITRQPATATAKNGGTVKFTVAASGDGLGYQWQISDDGGKTWRNSAVKSASYTTTLSNANNGRRMRCVVSDKYGNKVTSGAAAMWLTK